MHGRPERLAIFHHSLEQLIRHGNRMDRFACLVLRETPHPATKAENRPPVTTCWPDCRTIKRSTTFFSSRTLPGHAYATNCCMISFDRRGGSTCCCSLKEFKKCIVSGCDVVAPLAQRRNFQVDDVQAIVEIRPKRTGLDLFRQTPVGRRNDANVERAVRREAAHGLNLAGLEEAQQQRLHAHRHFTDFVEKHRAAIRRLEQARLVSIRAGETPLVWPNSSDSRSDSATPAQLTETRLAWARRLLR